MKYSKRMPITRVLDENQGKVETSGVTFDKALEVFLKAQEAANHSKETHVDYRAVLRLFFRYMHGEFGYTLIHEITEGDVLDWLAYLHNSNSSRGRPFSTRSIETYFRDVSVFFRWLVDHKYLTDNPLAMIKKPKTDKTLIRVFTEEDLKRLDAACERMSGWRGITEDEKKMLVARDRAVFWMFLSTGIRISELCGLRFSDIEWGKDMIYVRGKGAKERKIPFGKVARQHLNTYITYWRGPHQEDDHVFINLWGRPLKKFATHAIFKRLEQISGITDKRVSAHTCRHWFAVNAIKQGMPTIVLKGLLGHENWDMIEVYVQLAEQDNRELYTRFSPVDGLTMHHRSQDRRKELRDWRNVRKGKGKENG